MKSEITKGALYLFDDAYRTRLCDKLGGAQYASLGKDSTMRSYVKYENGIAVLGNIIPNSNDSSFTICQLLFNNKNGIKYLYHDELELAEKISK